jgi:hypothetical protein
VTHGQTRAYASRRDDEDVLAALHLRDRGTPYDDVARELGKDAGYWRATLAKVNTAYGRSEHG